MSSRLLLPKSLPQVCRSLESLLLHDPGSRGVRSLHVDRGDSAPSALESAFLSMCASAGRGDALVVATGFCLPPGETDGPPGAACLAESYHALFLAHLWVSRNGGGIDSGSHGNTTGATGGGKEGSAVRGSFSIVTDATNAAICAAALDPEMWGGDRVVCWPVDSEASRAMANEWVGKNGGGVPPSAMCRPVSGGIRTGIAVADDKRVPLGHLHAIERVGRNAQGRMLTMRARDVTEHHSPIDDLFDAAPGTGVPTSAVGDGGNEIGMGAVRELVAAHVDRGAEIACATSCEDLVPAGVSNWGGYALSALLRAAAATVNFNDNDNDRKGGSGDGDGDGGGDGGLGRRHRVTVDDLLCITAERARVERCVAAGAIDGVRGKAEISVDGFDWDPEHARMIERINEIVAECWAEGEE